MVLSPIKEIQKAIYLKLTNDATLAALISGVFDKVNQDTAFPYVTIGGNNSVDWGSHTFDGRETTINIHSWSESQGSKEAQSLMFEIHRILHRNTLTVTGHVAILLRNEFEEIMVEDDQITHHGIQRFRLITKEA